MLSRFEEMLISLKIQGYPIAARPITCLGRIRSYIVKLSQDYRYSVPKK
jgi:hypothetical protein